MLLFQISTKNQIASDRFYRALYAKLLSPAAVTSSKVLLPCSFFFLSYLHSEESFIYLVTNLNWLIRNAWLFKGTIYLLKNNCKESSSGLCINIVKCLIIYNLIRYGLHIAARVISWAVGESNEEWCNVEESGCIFKEAPAGLLFSNKMQLVHIDILFEYVITDM